MRLPASTFRFVAVAALAVAVLGASGCSWFRKGSELYAQSPENRPLEVPPDLNMPDTSGAMKLPGEAPQSVSRSSMAAPAQASAPNNTGFTVPGDRDAVFAKVGEVLAATEGVTIASKAQILGTYDIDYAGSKFLLRVTKVEAGAYVSAVDPRGMPAAGDAPAKLVATLKAALGAG
ncbi:MAG TPA: hypothetical protein VM619_10200 [Luteimonas sp.]|nr:hypothetical protein [Luteimonas sp.]